MTKLNVPEMSCGHCKAAIEKAVAGIDADARVTVDLENRTVSIESVIADAALIDALKNGGYEATVV
ncbi:MAG: heavy-metal-associated domain-containing protein [Alphaproteobacteria bacterium]